MRVNLKPLVWGFDIGGVISKYPNEFVQIVRQFVTDDYGCPNPGCVYFISDIHPNLMVDKGHGARYIRANEKPRKAVLIKRLGINIFIDDFDGYLQWDSSLGPQPILMKIMPDAFKPYWHDTWICEGEDFGRKKYTDIGVT